MVGKPKPENIPPGDHFVRVQVSEEHYECLRRLAFEARLSVAAYVRWLVARECEKGKPKGKGG